MEAEIGRKNPCHRNIMQWQGFCFCGMILGYGYAESIYK